MKRIKVAFFAENLIDDFDGASRTVFQILNRIPSDEFEFMYFTAVPPQNGKCVNGEIFQFRSVPIPSNETYRMGLPYFSKRAMWAALDDFQPDVIHFTSPSPCASYAKKYGKEKGVPVIAIYHTHFISYVKYYFRKMKWLTPLCEGIVSKITHNLYNDLNRVYVPTKEITKDLKKLAKLKGDNLKLWQRGLDNGLFNPGKKDPAFIKNITHNEHPNILFVSRLVWEKNLDELTRLYDFFEKKGTPANFIIAGSGIALKELKRKMPKAHFLGALGHDDLSRLYATADVFYFPSDTETYGNVVIEAMASGLPCVVANSGGPKSYIRHLQTGILCAVNDTEGYYNQILNLLNDSKLRSRIIYNALEFTRPLNWDNLVDIYFDDLRKMVRSRAAVTLKTPTYFSPQVQIE